jgi:hypothetical protein
VQAPPKIAPAGAIPDDWHMESPVPANGDAAAGQLAAPAERSGGSIERQYRALVTGLASLTAGNAAVRAALGCSIDFVAPGSLLSATDSKALQAALSSGDGAAVTEVLAGGLAHQAALLAAVRAAMEHLDGAAAIEFKTALASTYRQVFEAETRQIGGRKK